MFTLLLKFLTCASSTALAEAFLSEPYWSNLQRNIKSNAPFHRRCQLPCSTSDHIHTSVRSMTIKDLKMELDAALIDYSDVFEKEELVRRVIQARKDNTLQACVGDESHQTEDVPVTALPNNAIVVPLLLITPDSRKLMTSKDISLTIDTVVQFPAIQIQVPCFVSSKSKIERTLTLLVDTACSSLVLRPTVARQFGLPILSSPTSTMTGASGVATGVGQITQVNQFYLDEQKRESHHSRREFGPLPAALQEIEALPSLLDGIIGMSFFSRFEAVDFDFRSSRLIFHTEPLASNYINPGSGAPMQLVGSYGIYAVDAWFDCRGPIRLLLDTGASNTFINSQGVKDLGFQLVDLEPITATGAVGSDSVAIAMTHRLFINKSICLGYNGPGGIQLESDFEVCVSEVPILDSMPNINGILGIDALRRCNTLRLICKYPPTVTIF